MITHEELKEILEYNPKTGDFTWLKSHDYRIKVGSIAGYKLKGYIRISYKNIKYPAHRLAWFYMTKKWPENLIDHINGKRDDNRFSNLRKATHSQNQINSKIDKANTTGFKGVSYDRGKIRADITCNKKLYFLGHFKTLEEAAKAYDKKALQLYGDFAYLNFPSESL